MVLYNEPLEGHMLVNSTPQEWYHVPIRVGGESTIHMTREYGPPDASQLLCPTWLQAHVTGPGDRTCKNDAIRLSTPHLTAQQSQRDQKPLFPSRPRNPITGGGAVASSSKTHKMPEGFHLERPLFAGALTSTFPQRFQEVFVDPSRDESLIFEILELKEEVGDDGSASWFLQDLASEQESEGCVAPGLCYRSTPAVIITAVGQMAISKGRQEVNTDILISAYEPIHINPLSESATAVGAGAATPAELSGCVPMLEVFKLAVSTFKVNNWGLFGSV
ncbi:hypothetical protein G4B88_000848 [Cannabis sativa]|uniref:Uncharacterized protein n=2 Tax=Cannabis sativa TaxID=3483 RepID=A0A7J6DYM0_CANSA|nr:hypothetical protein G4B88_000848 [Cannabis sativa]